MFTLGKFCIGSLLAKVSKKLRFCDTDGAVRESAARFIELSPDWGYLFQNLDLIIFVWPSQKFWEEENLPLVIPRLFYVRKKKNCLCRGVAANMFRGPMRRAGMRCECEFAWDARIFCNSHLFACELQIASHSGIRTFIRSFAFFPCMDFVRFFFNFSVFWNDLIHFSILFPAVQIDFSSCFPHFFKTGMKKSWMWGSISQKKGQKCECILKCECELPATYFCECDASANSILHYHPGPWSSHSIWEVATYAAWIPSACASAQHAFCYAAGRLWSVESSAIRRSHYGNRDFAKSSACARSWKCQWEERSYIGENPSRLSMI